MAPLRAKCQRSPEPKFAPGSTIAVNQFASTGAGHSSSAQSDAGILVAIKNTVVSPLGALLGLALIVAAPITLVATQLTVANKAVIETASEPVTEWFIPAPATVIIEQRIAPAFPQP